MDRTLFGNENAHTAAIISNPMVLISDGSSEDVSHVWCKIDNFRKEKSDLSTLSK